MKCIPKLIPFFLFLSGSFGQLDSNLISGLKKLEPYEVTSRADTLSATFGDDFIYYPFGQYSDQKRFARSIGREAKIIRIQNGGNSELLPDEKFDRYIVLIGKDTAKILVVDRVGSINAEIVEAKFNHLGIRMKNGIEIGMSKSDVLKKYFAIKSESIAKQYNVLEICSALTGIWHYYTFDNEALKKIEIKSDYIWDMYESKTH